MVFCINYSDSQTPAIKNNARVENYTKIKNKIFHKIRRCTIKLTILNTKTIPNLDDETRLTNCISKLKECLYMTENRN